MEMKKFEHLVLPNMLRNNFNGREIVLILCQYS